MATKKPKNPNFVPCGEGGEVIGGRLVRAREGSALTFRGIACSAPVELRVRLEYQRIAEKRLPDGNGSNEASVLLPALAPGLYLLDWIYDSPVAPKKWQTTTEFLVDETVVFRLHKNDQSSFADRFGILAIEVVP